MSGEEPGPGSPPGDRAPGSGEARGPSHLREIAGRQVLFDTEGFLWNAEDWSDDLAEALAAEAGLAGGLDETHWRAVRFMRGFYAENGRGPLNRQLAKGTGLTLLELESMFPGGIRNGARRLAGLPNPKSCM